ncbi:class IV adenylate cyclase [bacterium]|nr:class IV adenylate cyclase [bacterium]
MRNLEAKFRLIDRAQAAAAAEAIGYERRGELIQRDTFFRTNHGKLKLREENGSAALIHYARERRGGLDVSDYAIAPVADPAALRAMLTAALGAIATVSKVRTLLARRNVRLHLDRVEGLGEFGEIEAVASPGENPDDYREEVAAILNALNGAIGEMLAVSYFEMMRG